MNKLLRTKFQSKEAKVLLPPQSVAAQWLQGKRQKWQRFFLTFSTDSLLM
jgi:hypothetical protein